MKNSSAETTRAISNHLVKTIDKRDYASLSTHLLTIAQILGDKKIEKEINDIKNRTSMPFYNFCRLYLASFSMPSNRGVIFSNTGQRVSWPELAGQAELEFVKPLNEVFKKLMARLGEGSNRDLLALVENVDEEVIDIPSPEVKLD